VRPRSRTVVPGRPEARSCPPRDEATKPGHCFHGSDLRRQGAMVAARRLSARLARQTSTGGRGVLAGLVGGDGLLQLLQGELQLVGCQLLGPATELVAVRRWISSRNLSFSGASSPCCSSTVRSISRRAAAAAGKASGSICTPRLCATAPSCSSSPPLDCATRKFDPLSFAISVGARPRWSCVGPSRNVIASGPSCRS